MNGNTVTQGEASTGLAARVRIAPRFQRAVRIDTDLGQASALDGFLCTASFARALTTLATQAGSAGQGAFTWTGPYGGGKSSLVLPLAALLGPRGRLRDQARIALGSEVSDLVASHLKPKSHGRILVAVMGSRGTPAALVWEALVRARLVRDSTHGRKRPSDAEVIEALVRISQRPNNDGLLLIMDELGKVLEHLAASGGDLHFFQELAERASRSAGRLLVLGILHQAFDEYARRLGKDIRDEWAKIQGRYLDIPLSVGGDEQLQILAGAIDSHHPPKAHVALCDRVTKRLRQYRPSTPATIGRELGRCWPLHPVTACLLGPISRRRFGQNQRSLFGFLNSHEPAGFQDFLRSARIDDLYGPGHLFDYLHTNLEPAILASPDGHRWSLAIEALERAEKHQATPLQTTLLKAIALLDLFRDRSGLYASIDVLADIAPGTPRAHVGKLLADLSSWSVVSYREHLSAYAIYAGSDFDLQAALDDALETVGQPELSRLKQLANLRPIVAKRHYHETGSLRWFEVDVVVASDLEQRVKAFKANGAMGQFLLVVATSGESPKAVREVARNVTALASAPVALGLSGVGNRLVDTARELLALECIQKDRPELSGDAVARREVDARLAASASALETEVRAAFIGAEWVVPGEPVRIEGLAGLARLASHLADAAYDQAPRIRNELLNRSDPSCNAVAALKSLLKAMVGHPSKPRLGIEGFPAERGLYESVLASTGLHVVAGGTSAFREPRPSDAANLKPLWRETDTFLARAGKEPVSAAEVYGRWRARPFGVREGLCPVLFIAYLLSRMDRYTVYLDRQFEVALTDLTVDRLIQDPATLTVRIFDANQRERQLFEGMRETVRDLRLASADTEGLDDIVPLARAIVGLVKNQPPFTVRTRRLTPGALVIRAAVRAASDPNTLLHESLPQAIDEALGRKTAPIRDCIAQLRSALEELVQAYARMLDGLEGVLRRELGVAAGSDGLTDLQERAARIQGLTGDYRLEAFIGRLRSMSGAPGEIEGIASLAANKPPRDWSDNDADRAALEIADLAQRFNRAEAFARVKGRPDGRHAIAWVVGLDRSPTLVSSEFEITERDRRAVLKLARELKETIQATPARDEIVLAALAQVGSDVLTESAPQPRRAAND